MFEINWVGQTLGAYTIVSKIGQGGMAVVYKAYEPALDRYVAIKILPPSLASESGFAARFEREAKAIAKLDHPNILPVYSYGQQSDLSYLVMRFVQAGTLKARMGQPLDLVYIAEIIRQVASALHYAHENGIIHRDIKPSNILMANEQWALLTDFGLAKMMESAAYLTITGVGIGTPAYMSPEQAQGLQVDRRTDIYSLGIMLYEMVVGKVPYEAETPMAVVLKHIHAPLSLPSQARPDLPNSVENVILKALAKRPEDRYQTAADFTKALDAAIILLSAETTSQPADVIAKVTIPFQHVGGISTQPAPEAPKEPVQPTVDNLARQMGNIPIEDSGVPHKQVLPKFWVFLQTLAGVIARRFPLHRPQAGVPKQSPYRAMRLLRPARNAGLARVLANLQTIARNKKFTTLRTVWPRSWWIGVVILMVLLIAAALTWRVWNSRSAGLVVSSTNTAPAIPVVLPTATISLPVKPSFIMRFTSSSGWASVSFNSGADIKSSERIAISGDPTVAERFGQSFNLNQDINHAFVGLQVTSTYNVFLTDMNASTSMMLSLKSGCLGHTEVEILSAIVEPPVVVFRQTINGCQEISFTVPFELLKTSTPIDLSRTEPPRPVLPSSADTDESKFVLYCPGSEPPNQQLCIIKVHSGQLIKLTEDFNFIWLGTPMWTSDGTQIYFFAPPFPEAASEMFVINADGTGETKLPVTGGGSWSPDGQTIAYSYDCVVLRMVRPDGTERNYLNTPGVRCMDFIRWSPDSTQLAFMDLFDFRKAPSSVWVINRDGTNLHRIYQFDTPIWYLIDLAWSPDGKSVGVWYKVHENDNLLGFLLDPAGIAAPQPIDWEPPVWWTPSFWPQWGQ